MGVVWKLFEEKKSSIKRDYLSEIALFIKDIYSDFDKFKKAIANGDYLLPCSFIIEFLKHSGVIKNRISQSKYFEIINALSNDFGIRIIEKGIKKQRHYIDLRSLIDNEDYIRSKIYEILNEGIEV